MAQSNPSIDPERQLLAKEYARKRRRLWVLEVALSSMYLIIVIAAGWAHQVMGGFSSRGWPFELLAVAIAIGLPWMTLTAPLAYYRGFILPHRYGLSTQTLGAWLLDQIKGMGVAAAIGIPLLLGFYFLMRALPDGWWFWSALGYNLVSVVLTALFPVLLLPVFFKQRPLEEAYESLRERLVSMAESVGAHVRGVYSIDMSRRTKAANAALAGLGRTRRILLGDTLLSEFGEDEIEAVLAHELGHHVHRDLPISILVQSAFNFVMFFVASQLMRLAVQRGLMASAADPAGLPILMLVFSGLGLLTMPASNAFSRWRERLADRFAVKITRKPAAFSSAMKRLANQNLSDIQPENWVVFLFYSHPPLRERIQMAEATAGEV